MELTRRNALTAGAAAVVASPALANRMPGQSFDGDDSELLALCERFHTVWNEHRETHHAWISHKHELQANPACPPMVFPAHDQAGWDRYEKFVFKDSGVYAICDLSTDLHREAGRILKNIFDTKARTPAGIAAKVAILRNALATDDGCHTDDMLCFENDYGERWFDSVLADLHKITGRAS